MFSIQKRMDLFFYGHDMNHLTIPLKSFNAQCVGIATFFRIMIFMCRENFFFTFNNNKVIIMKNSYHFFFYMANIQILQSI